MLRHWKPDAESPLPAPNDKFLQYEAALHWGYSISEWKTESTGNKAECIAHYLHAKMREAYIAEHFEKKAKGNGKKGGGLRDLMNGMGIGM